MSAVAPDPREGVDAREEAEVWRRRAELAIAAERAVSERFARLHGAAAALSAAVTPGEVAAVIAARGAALPAVERCLVALPPRTGSVPLRIVAARAARSSAAAGTPLALADGGPLAHALSSARAVFLRGADASAVTASIGVPAVPALAVLPLAGGPRQLGLVLLAFGEPRGFDEEERAFLEAFGHQCAQALDRARLYEAERAARVEAQRAEEAARRAMEVQERLVGIVGHDLRTPLAAIRMATSLLFRRGGLSDEQARTLARLGASAARMTHIIRDLLDFTRARKDGSLPVEPMPIDLADVVRRASAELQAVHPDRRILLELPAAAPLVGDPDRLQQVLSNLVGNAVQHGPPSAPIRVRVEAAPGVVAVAVHNEGPPIPAELVPALFEPFRQGARGGHDGSVGLGLFIVRELVRAHGGTVEVASSAEAGTTFTVRLPGPAEPLALAEDPTGRPAPER